MTSGDHSTSPVLEFVHGAGFSDIEASRRLAAEPGLSTVGLDYTQFVPGDDDCAAEHVFLLRHGAAVATLWMRDRPALPPEARDRRDFPPATCMLERLAARDRAGGGCSYRLLLTFWATQWLVAHRSLRAVAGICRTDAVHRYTPLGFRETGGWFHVGGPTGHSFVVVQADARHVIDTGRALGLQYVLDSAVAAAAGRGLVSDELAWAARWSGPDRSTTAVGVR